MIQIFAKQALLPKGWAHDVNVSIDDHGRISHVIRDSAGSAETDHQVGILLPAPVNAHSHAFQRALAGLTEKRGPDPRDSFWSWRQLMYRFLVQLDPDHIEAIAAFVQMEMLEAGYATSVEFHYVHHQPNGRPYENIAETSERIIAAAQETGIGLTLLPVHYQYGGCDRRALGAGQIRFGNSDEQFATLHTIAGRTLTSLPPDCRIGVAPHSLRAVAPESLPMLVAVADEQPIHMHLAEQQGEVHEIEAAYGKRPTEWLLDSVEVNGQWCLIHCTHMQKHETIELAATGAVAGLCPITESNLGDGIFDAVRWLENNGAIAIGSDSNIRIALAEELRMLEYTQRLRDSTRAMLATAEKSTGRRLYEAVVAGGAQAAGRTSQGIEPGAWGDLLTLDETAVDLQDRCGDAVLDSFVFVGDDRMVQNVWVAGRHRVIDGRHVERLRITERYRQVIQELRDAL